MKQIFVLTLLALLLTVASCKKDLPRDNPFDANLNVDPVGLSISWGVANIVTDDNSNGIAESGEDITVQFSIRNTSHRPLLSSNIKIEPQGTITSFNANPVTVLIPSLDTGQSTLITYSYSVHADASKSDNLSLLLTMTDKYGNKSQVTRGISMTGRTIALGFTEADDKVTNSESSTSGQYTFYVTNNSPLPVNINGSTFKLNIDDGKRAISYTYTPVGKITGLAPKARVKVGTLLINYNDNAIGVIASTISVNYYKNLTKYLDFVL